MDVNPVPLRMPDLDRLGTRGTDRDCAVLGHTDCHRKLLPGAK
jgi:hypothetical protein